MGVGGGGLGRWGRGICEKGEKHTCQKANPKKKTGEIWTAIDNRDVSDLVVMVVSKMYIGKQNRSWDENYCIS